MAETSPKSRLITAATEHFLRLGLSAAKIGDIAATAGIGKGSVYLHFPTKEALLLACCLELCDALDARFAKAMADAGAESADPVSALRRLLLGMAGDASKARPDQQRLFLDLWASTVDQPELRQRAQSRLREVYSHGEGAVAALYAAAVAQGRLQSLPDPRRLGGLVTAALDGWLWQASFRDDRGDAAQLVDQLLAMLGDER